MIYLLQPLDYPSVIQEYLRELLADKQLSLHILSEVPSPTEGGHTYFIINDSHQPSWSGIDYARMVRKQDKVGHLILLTDRVDHTKLFRSHLSFLEVIVFEQMVTAVTSYIDEFYITNNDGKC